MGKGLSSQTAMAQADRPPPGQTPSCMQTTPLGKPPGREADLRPSLDFTGYLKQAGEVYTTGMNPCQI